MAFQILKNLSIKYKLIGMVLLISVLATTLGFTFVIFKDIKRFKQEMINYAVVNAKLAGEYSIPPLVFNDKKGARDVLMKLQSIPNLTNCVLYDQRGVVFADYHRVQAITIKPPQGTANEYALFQGPYLHILQPIIYQNENYGSVYLRASTSMLDNKIRYYLITMGLVEIGIILFVFFLAYVFQGVVSRPILNLTRVMNTISTETNYSIRVQKENNDEIGELYDGFNNMLEQIQAREMGRDQAEKALQELNKQFLEFTNQLPGNTFIIEQDHSLSFVNQHMKDMFGADTWVGQKPERYLSPKIADRVLESDVKTLQTGLFKTIETLKDKWGKKRIYQTQKFPILSPGKPSRIGAIGMDITDLKRGEEKRMQLELRLQQSQKMEAIGTLAGGIAHDFNNILSVVLGYADMAMEDAPPGTAVFNDLKEVVSAGNRAKELVKQILAFSREANVERIPIQLQSIVKEVLKMIRASIPSTIDIRDVIDSKCGVVLADPTQIHQILMNLCTNANHAMENTGGILKIELKSVHLGKSDKQMELNIEPGEYVDLIVSDTGSGIDPDIIDKIFEPYFTTKETGKGTGMGLSIIHGIILDYGGTIHVESKPGIGTSFHVYFPVSEQRESLLTQNDEVLTKGHERILFIDDEEILAKMGKEMLERLGYSVTVRSSSLEALATFQNNPDKFDAVITDQTMPGMTGSDLARRMLQIRPDLPIILCTGYSVLIDEDSAKGIGIKEFALKPLTRKTIARLIRNVLDSK